MAHKVHRISAYGLLKFGLNKKRNRNDSAFLITLVILDCHHQYEQKSILYQRTNNLVPNNWKTLSFKKISIWGSEFALNNKRKQKKIQALLIIYVILAVWPEKNQFLIQRTNKKNSSIWWTDWNHKLWREKQWNDRGELTSKVGL